MTATEKIYKAIKKNSNFIIQHGDQWKRELAGSKNFITTPDFKYWTFGKSVGADGEYHNNGGAAKQRLYNLGFVNAFDLKHKALREKVVIAFSLWAEKVTKYPLFEKYERDQKANKRFELLVHNSIIDTKRKNAPKSKTTQQLFDEGFRKQISREILSRDKKVINLAKQEHGTSCAVCDFSFSKTYGEHGEGFIEMHHLYPLALGKRKTAVADLQPVCANCHRMLHRGTKLLSIEELKEIIKKAKY